MKLESKMLQEELDEFKEASENFDEVEMFDACLDLIVVAVGSMHKMGLTVNQMDRGMREVCDSNFSKLPMTKNAEGKIQKGPNFRPPNLEPIITSY